MTRSAHLHVVGEQFSCCAHSISRTAKMKMEDEKCWTSRLACNKMGMPKYLKSWCMWFEHHMQGWRNHSTCIICKYIKQKRCIHQKIPILVIHKSQVYKTHITLYTLKTSFIINCRAIVRLLQLYASQKSLIYLYNSALCLYCNKNIKLCYNVINKNCFTTFQLRIT